MTTEKSKHDEPEAAPAPAKSGEPGAMPSINEPEGSTIHPANPGGVQKPAPGPAPGQHQTQAQRLDNDPKVGDDDDDDDGGSTRTRTTTVQTKHKR